MSIASGSPRNTSDSPCQRLFCVLRYSGVDFHRSAFKHGCTTEEIKHAVDNAIEVVDLDPESDPPKVLAIGPDQSARWLEVIWLRLPDRDLVIHAMKLRTMFERFLEVESDE